MLGKGRVIVVGGGIAGLACAYYLRKHGLAVTLLERDRRVGGVMRTTLEEDRYLLEHGPSSFLSNAEPVHRLARELSLHEQLVTNRPEASTRYVVRRGRLEELPVGPRFITSRALSLRGKCRLLLEPFVKSRAEGDESVAAFVRRRAGREVLEGLVDPFVSGVYAGDTEQLSMASVFPLGLELERDHGSLLKGFFRKRKEQPKTTTTSSFFSFRWGMGTLPARLEEILRGNIHLNTTVDSMERLPCGDLCVRAEAPRRTFEANAVVLATPAWMSARMVAQLSPGVIAPLMAIPYAPIAVVHTVFRRSDIPRPLEGFGFLVPRREGIRLLGSLWSSSLFPGRCSPDQVFLTNYIGGAIDPRVVELEDHEILTHVMSGLETILGVTAQPRFVHVTRLVQAIPQYTIGHGERMTELTELLSGHPDIFLTGNYLRGISVAETIAHARETADRVLTRLGVWSPQQVSRRGNATATE